MSFNTTLNKLIDEKLKSLHVAFLAKVLSISGNKAKIQPLGLTRQYGGTAQKQAVITGVHIAESARNKLSTEKIEYVYNADGAKKTQTIAVPKPLAVGDVVICVCCDRNIDSALKGENALPPVGYHNQSDCVIVAII